MLRGLRISFTLLLYENGHCCYLIGIPLISRPTMLHTVAYQTIQTILSWSRFSIISPHTQRSAYTGDIAWCARLKEWRLHCMGVTRSPKVPVGNNVKRTGSHQPMFPCQAIVTGIDRSLRNSVVGWKNRFVFKRLFGLTASVGGSIQ